MEKPKEITKLSLTIGDRTVTCELDKWDPTADELVEAFVGLCVTQTFHPSTILNGMKTYIEEHDEN